MMHAAGRTLDPKRPWPTVLERTRQYARWVAVVVALSFFLIGLENFPDRPLMGLGWLLGARITGVGTYRIENYKGAAR